VTFWSRLGITEEPQSEGARLRAARRGDRPAFDSLIHLYEPPLRGYLLRRVGADAAEDVLQETWLAAWTALPKFAGNSRFKTWLFGIAQHKITDAYRLRGNTQTESWSDVVESRLPVAKDDFAASDLKHSVQEMLTKLPPEQREVLELYYFAELTLPEIGGTLGRNLNTVKYQFYRAHALAADGLREYGPVGAGKQP